VMASAEPPVPLASSPTRPSTSTAVIVPCGLYPDAPAVGDSNRHVRACRMRRPSVLNSCCSVYRAEAFAGRCWHDGHRRAAGDLSEAEQLFSLCLAAGDHDRVPAARAAMRRCALQRSRIREQGPALPHEAVRERIAAIPGTPGPLTLTAS